LKLRNGKTFIFTETRMIRLGGKSVGANKDN
jgi:hypothetical protein